MTNEKEIVVYADKMKSSEPMDFLDIRKNTALVKKALKDLMVKGVDYGTVPGCGDKLGLFKPGAEKLMFLFKLGCFPEAKRVEFSGESDEISFITTTKIVHIPTGIELGVGLGSASSNEEKYKWRQATKKEWDNTDENRRRLKYYKGDYDKKTKKYGPEKETYQVRTNPADLNNTLLKMSCKRSKVDGVITVTGASDIFTQDVEHEGDGLPTIQQEEPLKRPEAKEDKKKKETEAELMPEGFFAMKAKFPSKCAGCKGEIHEGDSIFYNKIAKEAMHGIDCYNARTA